MKRNTVIAPEPRITLQNEDIQALRADELEQVGGGALVMYSPTSVLENPLIYGIPADFFRNVNIPEFVGF